MSIVIMHPKYGQTTLVPSGYTLLLQFIFLYPGCTMAAIRSHPLYSLVCVSDYGYLMIC
jgi:hypothetical protein